MYAVKNSRCIVWVISALIYQCVVCVCHVHVSVPLFPSQGARAEQKELEVRSLAARLQASEQSAELLKSFSSPQVGLPPIGTVAMSRQVGRRGTVGVEFSAWIELCELKGRKPEWANPKMKYWKLHELHKNEVKKYAFHMSICPKIWRC